MYNPSPPDNPESSKYHILGKTFWYLHNNLDWHIQNLREITQDQPLGYPFPNAIVILDIAEQRRNLLLEDILHSQLRRLNLDLIFIKHRESLINIMTRIKYVIKYISKIQGGETLLRDYYTFYNKFMEFIPEYEAAFQEAVTYVNQRNLVPNSSQTIPYIWMTKYPMPYLTINLSSL